MASALTHRGPDDSGSCYFQAQRVALGFRRLSILDPSPAGHQPMSNEDGSVWLVFNGEIYNHRELRRGLERRGHRFRSRTDTEVIIHQYEEEGERFIRGLNGMFAFALLDLRRGRLLLARDHLGIKPLYYCRGNGCLVFGSEIKSILASGAHRPEVNWQAASDFLTYLYIPYPQTIFQGILQVPPAHVLQVDLDTLDLELERYWDPSDGEEIPAPEEAAPEVRRLLADAVAGQMISDVPLGLFLSGGVDSGILACLMAEASPRPVKTYTAVFEGPGLEFYDEGLAARAAAERFGTDHHEIPVRIADPQDMIGLLGYFDQPFGNPTYYLMHLISQATRPEVTVALCGAGGDELFAGYPRYRAAAIRRALRWVPPGAGRGAARLLRTLRDGSRTMSLRRAREFLDGWDDDPVREFLNWTYFFREEEKARLFASPFPTDRLPSDRLVRRWLPEKDPLRDGNRLLEADVRSFLVDNVLEYTDKMSMAASLEVRVPYLDHRLVSLALRIPFGEKLHGRQGKAVLRSAFPELPKRPPGGDGKRGFNVPLARWMRSFFDEYFETSMSRREVERHGIFDWEYLQALRHDHVSGRWDNGHKLFAVLVFDAWFRSYILQEGGASEPWQTLNAGVVA